MTVYGENKKQVGIFDVEVFYDISRLAAEISSFTGGGIRVSSVNGRIMLSGTAPDAVTLDKAVMIAGQFAPDPINTVQVMQPQQVMLEVRFIEVSRQASRELGVQWNVFGRSVLANVGSRLPANQLPATVPGGSFQQPGMTVGGPNISPQSATISPTVAAGVLSGTGPFGFLIGRLIGHTYPLDLQLNALEEKGLARSLAEPNLVGAVGRHGKLPRRRRISGPGARHARHRLDRLQALRRRPRVHPDGAQGRPDQHRDQAGSEPARHSNPVQVAGISVPPLIVRRASTTIELRDGQSFMLGGLLQNTSNTAQDQLPWLGDVPVLGALFRGAQYKKNETDLVIIVTPHIVRPLRPNDPIHTPLDNTLPANDIDFFLMGQPEVSPALARFAVGALNRPNVGHILDLPKKGGFYVSVKD